jgi:hypothetical protein
MSVMNGLGLYQVLHTAHVASLKVVPCVLHAKQILSVLLILCYSGSKLHRHQESSGSQ